MPIEADGLLYEAYKLLDPVIQDFGMDDDFPFVEAMELYHRIGAYLWPEGSR